MAADILFILAMLGLSQLLTYIWWVKLRVWVLKQDVFEVRDRLWDAARAGGFLDDPGYQGARIAMNAVVRLAPQLCLPAWLYAVRRADDLNQTGLIKGSSIYSNELKAFDDGYSPVPAHAVVA